MANPLPNLHHLELFHHVATAGGISAAVRSMPYGIQQPAVSSQIAKLESELGVGLFQRRPFRLTAAGAELHAFLDPFFRDLPEVMARVAGKARKHLRIGAPAVVIRDYLPDVLSDVRAAFPDVEISIRDARHGEMLAGLESGELDLAVIEREGRPPRGMKCETLAELPLVLWLPPGMKAPRGGIKALAATEPLLRPPADTVMARLFERGLQRRGIHWPARMELRTAELALAYAMRGFGIGLGHQPAGGGPPPGVTAMPLPGFSPLVICAMWSGRLTPPAEHALHGLREIAGCWLATPRESASSR